MRYESLIQEVTTRLTGGGGILDIETLGLERGSYIHQIALRMGQRTHVWKPAPNYVVSRPYQLQDVVGFASSAWDVHERLAVLGEIERVTGQRVTERDVVTAHVLLKTGRIGVAEDVGVVAQRVMSTPWEETVGLLGEVDPWLAEKIRGGVYSWLPDRGGVVVDREAAGLLSRLEREAGRPVSLYYQQEMGEILRPGGELASLLGEGPVWIHGAQFEAKQFGAQVAAIGEQNVGIRQALSWTNPKSPDMFYVTGPEVNVARTEAVLSGDWTGVWKAYLAHTGKGDVRDIIDLLRAGQSYARKLGYLRGGAEGKFTSLSADVNYRLAQLIYEGNAGALAQRESHLAHVDVNWEEYIRNRAIEQNWAMQQVAENTATGRQLLDDALRKRGPLWNAGRHFAALEEVNRVSVEQNLLKRLDRMFQNFAQAGVTRETVASFRSRVDLRSRAGQEVESAISLQERQTFTSWDRAWAFIRADQQYAGVDVERVHREYQEEMMRRGWMAAGPAGTELRASGVPGSAAYVRERAEALDEALISRVQRNVSLWERDVAARASRRISGFWDIPWGNVGKGVAALALSSLVVAGGIVLSGRGKPKLPPSLRTVSYEKWLASQGQFYGNRDLQETGSEGMSVGGISEFQRRALTDFGSPYRGPWGSNQVLTDQALLQERERYLREVYGVTHFDPVSGIFSGIRNLYSFSGRVLHRYIREGARPANAADFGLRGTGLFQIDLSKGDWQVTAEDADTIVVKKGGVPGLLHSLLGGNKGFAFRLAGIDSPEVYHPGRWRTPQPYAEEGRDAFRAMIEAGNLQLVFQPSEITYGRQLGVLFGAGKDLNKELVRRGLAASLPFKTTNQPMANYAAIGGIESRAFANQRGMWSQPFWQAYHDVAETFGERITFNTLANAGSLAKNATLMSTASLMWAAQDMGMYSTADQIAATELGRRMREVGIKGDYLDPVIIARSAVPSQNDHMLRLMSELQDYTRTSGENRNSWIKKRGGFRNLDKTLVLDSLGTTNKVWQKPRYEAYEIYGTELQRRRDRLVSMQEAQQRANEMMFQSPIGHTRM